MNMQRLRTLVLSWLLLALASPGLQAGWQPDPLDMIDLEVVTDRGRELPQYPVESQGRNYRAYLEAQRDVEYLLEARNRTGERIGLVIAVDGRNIIDGSRSELGHDEPMYVLGPHERGNYEGWRTGRNRVNRFYFTDPGDSYAGAWGDHSAMGVIAVAVYRERDEDRTYYPSRSKRGVEGAGAGTGFGDEAWSPTRRVSFSPRAKASAKYFLKYEWPRTLCKLGIKDDCRRPRDHHNRFWPPQPEYAPYPPGYWRR